MLWSTLPAVHLIFWAVYLWKLSKRWTGPNTTILQAVSSPSFQLRTLLSVCIYYLVTTQSKQSMAVVATTLYILYIGFFCYFSGHSQSITQISTLHSTPLHLNNLDLNCWVLAWYILQKKQNEDENNIFWYGLWISTHLCWCLLD